MMDNKWFAKMLIGAGVGTLLGLGFSYLAPGSSVILFSFAGAGVCAAFGLLASLDTSPTQTGSGGDPRED